MIKKLIYGVICIMLIISMSSCNIVRRNRPGTDNFTKYEKGFFTKEAYYNECLNLKFKKPSGLNFLAVDSANSYYDNKNEVGNFLSLYNDDTTVEAMCSSGQAVVIIFNEKIGKTDTIDDISKSIMDAIKKDDTDITDLDDNGNVDIADKDYREIAFTTKKNGEKIKSKIYVRIVGDNLFVIDIAVNKNSNMDAYALLECFTKIGASEDVSKIRIEEGDYNEKIKKDKSSSVDQSKKIYIKGINDGKEYKNATAGIKYTIPNKVSVSNNVSVAEFEVSSDDSTCIMDITSVEAASFNTEKEYLDAAAAHLIEQDSNFVLIDNDKQEDLGGQKWSVMNMKKNRKDGVVVIQKYYVRIIGDTIMTILFQYSSKSESTFERVKSGFAAY